MKSTKIFVTVLLTLFFGIMSANTQITDKVRIHGFGGWGYGKTDGNPYLIGINEGSFHHSQLSFNISTNLYEKWAINTQVSLATGYIGDEIKLDFAFGEWAFSDALKFRMGKVKCPFGIYSEVFDVGTVRPFYALPQAIYGVPGIVTKSYFGIGLTGSYYLQSGWGVRYDLYGGELIFQDWDENFSYEVPIIGTYEVNYKVTPRSTDMVGGMLILDTPVEDLNFGFSCNSGMTNFLMDGEKLEDLGALIEDSGPSIGTARSTIYDVHAEYLFDALSIRTEYMHLEENGELQLRIDGAYVEAAVDFLKHFQAAALWDYQNFGFAGLQADLESLFEHKEWAFGLNYWFKPGLVLKLSYHTVEGNFFARSGGLFEAVSGGSVPNRKTNCIVFGTQFSF
jgi:hypothetical protein